VYRNLRIRSNAFLTSKAQQSRHHASVPARPSLLSPQLQIPWLKALAAKEENADGEIGQNQADNQQKDLKPKRMSESFIQHVGVMIIVNLRLRY
jgi:hypothetical protein